MPMHTCPCIHAHPYMPIHTCPCIPMKILTNGWKTAMQGLKVDIFARSEVTLCSSQKWRHRFLRVSKISHLLWVVFSDSVFSLPKTIFDAPAMSAGARVFLPGNHRVLLQNVDCGGGAFIPPPPKPLLVAYPADAGEFPVLFFLHGYLLYNSFYSDLIRHIASHGFIVVAPQVLLPPPPHHHHHHHYLLLLLLLHHLIFLSSSPPSFSLKFVIIIIFFFFLYAY